MGTLQVTFTGTHIAPNRDRLTCRETGITYELELEDGAYTLRRDGSTVARRAYRDSALRFIEQLARLDLRTAQSVSAFAA